MAGKSPNPELKRSLFVPEYAAWNNLKNRCSNVKAVNYHRYGGRGITVCESWLKFDNFLKDMGKRPTNKHSIDRINNDLGYCKENCKWAIKEEQVRNRRTNVFLDYNDTKMVIKDVAKLVGLNYQLLQRRMKKGLTLEEAINKKYKYTKS